MTTTPMPFFNLRENPPTMEFVTAAGMHGGGGLEFVRYEVRGNPPQLVLTALPMLGFDEGKCGSIDTRDAPQAVLLDGFRSLEFEPSAYEEGDSWKSGGSDEFGLPRSVRVRIDGLAGSRTTAESAEWTIPIVANLESEDGFRIFSQMFEEGEGITIAGSAAAEDGDESGKKGATPNNDDDERRRPRRRRGRVRRASGDRARQRGVALILTLWAFMVLGVLALDFGRWMREDAMAGANFAEETQGYYGAYAGMQIALWKARLRLANGSLGTGDDDPTPAARPLEKTRRRRSWCSRRREPSTGFRTT